MGPGDLEIVLQYLNPLSDPNVVVGFEQADDAAVYRIQDGNVIVQSVDFFTPIVDDPYHFGQIAAANALSDIYAMGAKPLFALNIVGFPKDELPLEMLGKILQGGEDKAKEAGIAIIGGHSIDDKEPKYGMVVTGIAKNIIKNSGAKPNDAIILTKPLGTGIIATAIKKGVAELKTIQNAVNTMTMLNKTAAEIMRDFEVHACSDVTGFGLLGHLKEMLEASNVSAELVFQKITFLPDVRKLAEKGIMPGGSRRNLSHVAPITHFSEKLSELDCLMIADAQTSGGLLICVPAEQSARLVAKLQQASVPAQEIGRIAKEREKRIFIQ
ncbi:MAG: selenide, water dikinase SelD [Candidatus Marinimicrobia bacterium]|nr:selenide, water dikinase SelD [Candidatus Neomarinimicrobiota bacterium]